MLFVVQLGGEILIANIATVKRFVGRLRVNPVER